jgi:hypothetical protein
MHENVTNRNQANIQSHRNAQNEAKSSCTKKKKKKKKKKMQ